MWLLPSANANCTFHAAAESHLHAGLAEEAALDERQKNGASLQDVGPSDGIEGLFDGCELRFGRDKRLAEVSKQSQNATVVQVPRCNPSITHPPVLSQIGVHALSSIVSEVGQLISPCCQCTDRAYAMHGSSESGSRLLEWVGNQESARKGVSCRCMRRDALTAAKTHNSFSLTYSADGTLCKDNSLPYYLLCLLAPWNNGGDNQQEMMCVDDVTLHIDLLSET